MNTPVEYAGDASQATKLRPGSCFLFSSTAERGDVRRELTDSTDRGERPLTGPFLRPITWRLVIQSIQE